MIRNRPRWYIGTDGGIYYTIYNIRVHIVYLHSFYERFRTNAFVLIDIRIALQLVYLDEYKYSTYVMVEEEATKVFGPGKGESRVTRPQNIKTPSTGGAPATRAVLSRAKLSCDTLRALHAQTVINNTVSCVR